jgi:hypothetical protein
MRRVCDIGNYETGTCVIRDSLGNEHVVTAQAAPPAIRTEVPVVTISQDHSVDEVKDDLDEGTRLKLALGPDGHADALLRQVQEEAELEMRNQYDAEEDGYVGDSEQSSGEEVYVNEGGSGNALCH